MGKTYDIIPSSLKTSLLVNRQVPEFVREEHPLFISFLEAYYEFLENEQGVQNNDLTKTSKDLRYLHDVDFSIDAFENSFLNQYANLVPKDVKVDKAFLIKNLLPLYLAKGNPKSFQLLFRMFFGEEVEVVFPADQLLRASDGKYASESILTISDEVTSFYKGTGLKNQSILLAQKSTPDQFDLRINGIKKENETDYIVRVEDQKVFFNDVVTVKRDILGNVVVGTNLQFIDIKSSSPSYNLQSFVDSGEISPGNTTITFKDATSGGDVTKTILLVSNSTNLRVTSAYANANTFGDNTSFLTTSSVSATPASNADIRVTYKSFNDGLLKNRQFTGSTSNSSIIVERVFPRKIDILPKIELFFDPRKSDGSFEQSEEVTSTILVQNTVINISTNTFSSLEEIRVDKGGRLYNIGDPVGIIAGGFSTKATAQVASLGTEFLSNPTVNTGGAGFAVGGLFQGGNTETGFVLYTVKPAIDTSGNNTPNTFILMGETYDATVTNNSSQTYADLIIANANGTYAGAFGNTQVTTPTVDSRIKHVVNSTVQAVSIGPVQNVLLVTSNTTTTDLPLDGAGALVEVAARTTADVGSLKSLGKLQMASSNGVANVGNNYTVGDIIEFDSPGAGDGALARVSETNANGHIINTEFEYPHYENFGTGIRNNYAFIATVVANTGFRGVTAIPNVYVSSVVTEAINLSTSQYPNVNVGLSGVYLTPQSNHNGLTLAEGDNPVRIGDIISVLGHERKVINVSSNISVNAIGYNTNRYGVVTQNTGNYQSYSSNLSPVLDSQVGNTGNAGGYITRTISVDSLAQYANLNVRPVFHYTSGPNTKSQIMLDDINVDSMVYTFGEWSSSQNTALESFTRFDGSLKFPYEHDGGYLGGYNSPSNMLDTANFWEQRSPRMGSNTADYGQAFSGRVAFSGGDFYPTFTKLLGSGPLGEFSGGERGKGRWVLMAHGPNETPRDFSTVGGTVYRKHFGQYDDLNFASGLSGVPFITSNTNTFGAEANGQIRYAGDGFGANDNKNWIERATSNAISISEQKYIYANTYNANNSHFWLRGPVMSLGESPTFTFASCLFGDAVGTLNVHFDVVESNSNPETLHSGGFLTVDKPFPSEIDFLKFGNTSYFGTRGLANSLDPISISAQSSNVFGAPMSIDTNFPKGGAAYDTAHLPNVSIFRTNLANEIASSANAVINVACLLGDGEEIVAQTDDTTKGTINTIRIVEAGDGYVAIPDIDLTGSGDGTATANAVLTDSVSTTEGRFTSSDGLLSSRERRIQGKNFYQDFVYVTKVPLEFSKYKTVLKGLLHPAGYKNYAEFEAREISNVNVSASGTVSNSIPGTINVSNSISVVGTNTAFNIAVSKGTISVGSSKLAVNGENRVISSVISNTSLTVESAFTQVSNGQSAIILV